MPTPESVSLPAPTGDCFFLKPSRLRLGPVVPKNEEAPSMRLLFSVWLVTPGVNA
jgi:hypothetical protein